MAPPPAPPPPLLDKEWPIGKKAQREVFVALKRASGGSSGRASGTDDGEMRVHSSTRSGADVRSVISDFASKRDLGGMMRLAFGTAGPGGGPPGAPPEPTDPGPALTFVTHLRDLDAGGLPPPGEKTGKDKPPPPPGPTPKTSYARIHAALLVGLRSALETEIASCPLPAGPEDTDHVLYKLLKSSMFHSGTDELRPVVLAVLRRLSDKIPREALRVLGPLMGRLPAVVKRLVWEADEEDYAKWKKEERVRIGKGERGVSASKHRARLMAGLIAPSVEKYMGIEEDKAAEELAGGDSGDKPTDVADAASPKPTTASSAIAFNKLSPPSTALLAFVGSVSDRKAPTRNRRGIDQSAAVHSIYDVIGDNTALLHSAVDIILCGHGAVVDGSDPVGVVHPRISRGAGAVKPAPVLLWGARGLRGSLLSDLILGYTQQSAQTTSAPAASKKGSQGSGGTATAAAAPAVLPKALPRYYAHLSSLAGYLDGAVRAGMLSDACLIAVQNVLRLIAEQTTPNSTGGDIGDGEENGCGSPQRKRSREKGGGIIVGVAPKDKPSKKKKKDEKVAAGPAPTSVIRFEDMAPSATALRSVLRSALGAMRTIDEFKTFARPVTDEVAPGYSEQVSDPICIAEIEEKIVDGDYVTLRDYETDVVRMFNNCRKYNNGPDGTWFRNEADRQEKLWRRDVWNQARQYLKSEMDKASRLQASAPDAQGSMPPPSSHGRKRPLVEASTKSSGGNRAGVRGATDFSPRDVVSPLPPIRPRKRPKKELPSVIAAASLLIADPFVIRLVLKRFLSAMEEVVQARSLPSSHRNIPALCQLMHLAVDSAHLCAYGGRRLWMPSSGTDANIFPSPYAGAVGDVSLLTLRSYLPVLVKILLESVLDRRMAKGGDLFQVSASGLVARSPATSSLEWKGSASLAVVRAAVQGALVDLFQPSKSTEKTLSTQVPRFASALERLGGSGSMLNDGPFGRSLASALLAHKLRLPHATRDLVVTMWLKWLEGAPEGSDDNDDEDITAVENVGASSLAAPMHEMFVYLLNEWSALGNVVMPRDKMLSISEEAARVAGMSGGGSEEKFGRLWRETTGETAEAGGKKKSCRKQNEGFLLVRKEYERLLGSLPEPVAEQWLKKVGVTEDITEDTIMEE